MIVRSRGSALGYLPPFFHRMTSKAHEAVRFLLCHGLFSGNPEVYFSVSVLSRQSDMT